MRRVCVQPHALFLFVHVSSPFAMTASSELFWGIYTNAMRLSTRHVAGFLKSEK